MLGMYGAISGEYNNEYKHFCPIIVLDTCPECPHCDTAPTMLLNKDIF